MWQPSLAVAIAEAQKQQKPLMMCIHREWCAGCKALMPQIRNDPKIISLSQHFVMVECKDENDPEDPKYAPDGEYVPR